MAFTGWTNRTTWNWHAGMQKYASVNWPIQTQRSPMILLTRQRSAVPEVVDPVHKHSPLHHRLQWIRTLLHDTAHLQCNCQWNRTVPVLLQRHESWRWQDLSGGLCVCPWYNFFHPRLLCLVLILLLQLQFIQELASFKFNYSQSIPHVASLMNPQCYSCSHRIHFDTSNSCIGLTLNICHVCPMTLDYKVPFVPSEKEYEVVFIREGERVVIPCRGSVEDLNVTLHTVRSCFFSHHTHNCSLHSLQLPPLLWSGWSKRYIQVPPMRSDVSQNTTDSILYDSMFTPSGLFRKLLQGHRSHKHCSNVFKADLVSRAWTNALAGGISVPLSICC